MDGMILGHEEEDGEPPHVYTGSFTIAGHDDQQDEDDKAKGKGKQDSGIFGDRGEGVYFDENEGFDATELQGLPYYDFITARRKGLPLRRRMNDGSEQYLRSFIDEAGLREHIYEVAPSEHGHPTLLLDTGHLVQFQLYANDLQRVRVSADIDPEIGVRIAIKAFIAAGKSVDPKDVKFGSSEAFEARMKPVWTRCYSEMRKGVRTPHIDIPRSTGAPMRRAAPRAS